MVRVRVDAVVTVLAAAASVASLSLPAVPGTRHGAERAEGAAGPGEGLQIDKAETYRVAQEIGPGAINATASRWDVYGADLGSMFTSQGRLYVVFGDTFGAPAANPFFSVNHSNWRSNTMAYVTSRAEPVHGLHFAVMITNSSGEAEQLLSSKKVVGVEQTVIPTYGTAVGRTMYLYYMSVKQYGAPGHWTCNYSGVAYSKDNGEVWAKYPHLAWAGNSNFGQVALVKKPPYIYVFGIHCGRYGGLELARVAEADVLVKEDYRYWDGDGWVAALPRAAVTLVPAPVGELSVQWNSFYRRWLMMYLMGPTGQIVLRTARNLTGPWGDAQVVVTSKQYPELYAPYITPEWDNGPAIYFNMSLYGLYQVVLMHTQLSG